MTNDNDIGSTVSQVYDLLKGLDSSEAQRVVKAASVLLDIQPPVPAAPQEDSETPSHSPGTDNPDEYHADFTKWLRTKKITSERLAFVFEKHEDGFALVLDEMPGASDKERTCNAYLLAGLLAFAETGSPSFTDDCARDICRDFDCYSGSNHVSRLNDLGGSLSGNKKSGWSLSTPGKKKLAHLLATCATDVAD